MKNADSPAMPQSASENGYGCNYGNEPGQVAQGLTKREMIAKDIDVSFINNFDNYKEMASFLGETWNPKSNSFSNLKLKARVQAKLKVIAADALLAELDKCKS